MRPHPSRSLWSSAQITDGNNRFMPLTRKESLVRGGVSSCPVVDEGRRVSGSAGQAAVSLGFGGGLVDAGDGVEQVEGATKGCHRRFDASGELADHGGELVVLVQIQAGQERVVLAEASGQGLGGFGDPVAEFAFGRVREDLRVGFAADEGFEHGPPGDAHDVGGDRGELDAGVLRTRGCETAGFMTLVTPLRLFS
ncbi:hypothetical protein ACWD48_05585 [Streptomyces sp. NPDC002519]